MKPIHNNLYSLWLNLFIFRPVLSQALLIQVLQTGNLFEILT